MSSRKGSTASRRKESRREDSSDNQEEKNPHVTLYKACEKGEVEIVNKLLTEGVSPCIPNQAKWLPIHGAALSGHTHVVERLLKEPTVDIDARNPFQETALTLASCWGHNDLVRFLLDKGADITLKDWQDRDAVAFAKSMFGKSRKMDLIELLESAALKQQQKKQSNSSSTSSAPSNSSAPSSSTTTQTSLPSNTSQNSTKTNDTPSPPSSSTTSQTNQNSNQPPTSAPPKVGQSDPSKAIPPASSNASSNSSYSFSNSNSSKAPSNPPVHKPVPVATPVAVKSSTPPASSFPSTAAAGGKKKIHFCAQCGKEKVYKKCGACKGVYYCNKTCQEKGWMTHQKICQSLIDATINK